MLLRIELDIFGQTPECAVVALPLDHPGRFADPLARRVHGHLHPLLLLQRQRLHRLEHAVLVDGLDSQGHVCDSWKEPKHSLYYPGNKEGHIPTRSASEGPMKSSESRRRSPWDD